MTPEEVKKLLAKIHDIQAETQDIEIKAGYCPAFFALSL